MRELYFTSPYRSSLRTIRIEYGKVSSRFILKLYEGEINIKGECESNPKQELFIDERGLLNKVFEIRSVLIGLGFLILKYRGTWIVQNKKSILRSSVIYTNIVDGNVSVEFES